MSKRSIRPSRAIVVLLCCILALPTMACLMGFESMPGDFSNPDQIAPLRPYLVAGAALGLVQMVLRPLLRIISLPLGCITFGLSGMVIDVLLIYLIEYFVEAFQVPSFLYALFSAMLINTVCAIVGGRR